MSSAMASEAQQPAAHRARPRVFVGHDAAISRLRLSQVLRAAGYDVVLKPDGVSLRDAVVGAEGSPDVLLLPIVPDDPSSLESIRELHAEGLTRGAPILGVTAVDRGGLDLEALRRVGISGVLDPRCVVEDVVFRVNQLVRGPHERRRHLRVSPHLSVELTANGVKSHETAYSLSVGGMGVRSRRRIEPNTDVRVRFDLSGAEGESVDAKGRTIYVRESEPSAWDFGMFFYPLSERETELIHCEVERLLALQ